MPGQHVPDDPATVEFNWNVFPVTRLEESQMAAPLGCLYSPFSSLSPEVPQSSIPPVTCQTCQAYLNPFIKLDRKNGMWWCPFCEKRSYLPESLQIPDNVTSVDDWPVEMRETSLTIDYYLPEDITTPSNGNSPLIYYFVIDRYRHTGDSSFSSLIGSIIDTVHKLPSPSLIGLMTFNKGVQVHSIAQDEMIDISIGDIGKPSTHTKLFLEETVLKLLSKLGLQSSSAERSKNQLVEKGYLVELNPSSIGFITDYIRNVPGTFTESFKPPRATGLAHYIYSIMFSQVALKNFSSKVLFFTSGPGTEFPGKIVDFKDKMRTHSDIYALDAEHFSTATKFYTILSYLANGQSIKKSIEIYKSSSANTTKSDIDQMAPVWSVHLFAGSLDQVGAYEMKPLTGNSSGSVYLMETFDSYLLKQVLERCIEVGKHKAVLEVSTSARLKTSKLVYSGSYALPSSYHKASKFHHMYHEKIDDELGEFDSPHVKKGFTNRWKFNELKQDDALSLFFKMDTVRSATELTKCSISEVFIQFKLRYWDPSNNKWVFRVTTIRKPTTLAYLKVNEKHKSEIFKDHKFILGFNQKVWVVLLSRLLINKIDTNLGYASFDKLVDQIDGTIIKLLYYFGGISVNVNHAQSSNPYYRLQTMYEINENFKALPSLVYNLRRNFNLVRIFNSSPDETAFYHSWFLRTNERLSLKVIEPVLYNVVDGDVTRFPLDTSCLEAAKHRSFLVLDTGFLLVLYYQYAQNEKLPLHPSNNDSMIENRSELLPWKFIHTLVSGRQIVTKIIVTQRSHSQARFLLSRLNPIERDLPKLEELEISKASSYWSFLKPAKPTPKIMTDDVSLKQYYDNLVQQVKNHRI
ncbi:Protein transport protein SEC23 [Candida viswanathii]|uniref:Protein transport protein SEC23 n=1 Tax=Candida viswanathii TaxID=5486 RepID=A0A367XW40_9ASCO|nr:Protein transport protein SEC23 [Candida viswanathii]